MHKVKNAVGKRRTKAYERRHIPTIKFTQLNPSISSTSTVETSESYLFSRQDIDEEEEEQELNIANTIYDTDSDSVSEEDEPEYIQCLPLEEEVDFFEAIGDIPAVENISHDISEEPSLIYIPKRKVVVEEVIKDTGKFVDPLTGEIIQSSEDLIDFVAEDDVAEDETKPDEEIVYEVVETIKSDDDMFLLDDDIFEDEEEIKVVTDVDDTLEIFLEMKTQTVVPVVDKVDWKFVAREQELKRVEQNTVDFVEELIKMVVEAVEYISPKTILRQNLDKHKLLNEILTKLPEYNVEKSVCQLLNRKIIEYFRRKRSFRPIMSDNPKTATLDKMKFKEAVQRLDYLLEKESELKKTTSKIIKNLQNEYDEAKKQADTEVQQFTRMVRTCLRRENYPRCNALIELLLSRMNKNRIVVSEVRFEMIIYQHHQARLMESLAKMEDLGNGLHMSDFTSLQAETQALGKKIEERNTDLNKVFMRCHSNIHTMAHLKEKQKMFQNIIDKQRSVLMAVVEEKHDIRERLHVLKLRQKSIRNQIKELSFQGGLLDKPVLMLDYDATVQLLIKKNAIVDDLKKSLLASQHKINKIVKICRD